MHRYRHGHVRASPPFSESVYQAYHTSFWILRSLDRDVKRDRTSASEHPSAAITIPTAVCATSCNHVHSHSLRVVSEGLPA